MTNAALEFLKVKSSEAWLDSVMSDFNSFLVDHAACERKASATCMSFVVKYPNRLSLVDTMIRLAREELAHFHEVFHLLEQRSLKLGPDEKGDYVTQMMALCRNGIEERLLDRLILAAVFEARGCERFFMISEALPDEDLKKFYRELSKSEERHHLFFIELAHKEFPHHDVPARVQEILTAEASVLAGLPPRASLY
jgi:tRNA-(ms[2]io[6]A)-hydroxylase